MDTDFLVDAIKYLKPNAEFSYTNDDYSTIKWDVLEGNPPTEAELLTAIEQIKNNKLKEETTKAAEKAALLAKLGITEDEAKLLLG